MFTLFVAVLCFSTIYCYLYYLSLKRILRLQLFHGFVLVTFQLLLSYPLIKIWSPDCLLPVLGGCDGRWAGLGWAGLGWAGLLHSVSSKHPFFIFRAVQCSAAQFRHQTTQFILETPGPGSNASIEVFTAAHRTGQYGF